MRVIDSIHDTTLCERISDNMYLDNNGQLICEGVVLARTGDYSYREDELIPDGSSEKIVTVHRSPEEVFDDVSMKSMNYKPFVDEHPEDNITPDTVGELQKGFMTNIRKGSGEFDGCLMADLVVTDPYVIDLIRSGKKRELSVGYTADIVEDGKGGYEMKNIRGNHIALCEAGRAGNARIRDSLGLRDSKDAYAIYFGSGTPYVCFANSEEGAKHWAEMAEGDKATKVVKLQKGTSEYYYRVGDPREVPIADAVKNWGSYILTTQGVYMKDLRVGDRFFRGNELFELVSSSATSDGYGIKLTINKLNKSLDVVEKGIVKIFEYDTTTVYKVVGTRKDSVVKDFEAKGSFGSIEELVSFYKGSTTEARDGGLLVRLANGDKLLYSFVGDGKLAFIRRVKDSVQVLGDTVKLREGQRISYLGEENKITEILPHGGKFLIEFGAGDGFVARVEYDDFINYVNKGTIKLLDSVVFDSEEGDFKLIENENYSDCFKDREVGDSPKLNDPADEKELDRTHFIAGDSNLSDSTGSNAGDFVLEWIKKHENRINGDKDFQKLVAAVQREYMAYPSTVVRVLQDLVDRGYLNKRGMVYQYVHDSDFVKNVGDSYNRGDKVKPREGGSVEEIVDIITESTGAAGYGKTAKKYVMKSGRKYLAEDIEGSSWVKDSAMKPYSVKVGGRSFRVVAEDSVSAVRKVRAAFCKDSIGRANLQMFVSPSKVDFSGVDIDGEIAIVSKNDEELRGVERALFKLRVPIERKEGKVIYISADRVLG